MVNSCHTTYNYIIFYKNIMKALFINGSPRKNGNTAKLLQRAMEGAEAAGAEVEWVNLYV